MNIVFGDLWDFDADAVCVTTNGVVKRDGRLVMGKGVALDALRFFPGIDLILGRKVQEGGNHVYAVPFPGEERYLVSFPTKHDWRYPSDLGLIEQSAQGLLDLTEQMGWRKVVLPRPGCGAGQLEWNDVKAVLKKYLDGRFYLIDRM